MGALDWLWKRAVRGAATALRTDPALQMEVQDAVSEALGLKKDASNQPPKGGGNVETAPSEESLTSNMDQGTSEGPDETTYPGDEGNGGNRDPVLDVLYEAMEDARSKGRYDKAVDLARQIKRVRGGMGGGRPPVEGKFDVKHQTADLDLNNLAPHAEDIASDVLGAFKEFIPGDLLSRYGEAAKNQIAGEIRKNPTIVKDLLDTVNGTVRKWAGVREKPKGGQEQGKPGAYDPSDPYKLGMSKEEMEGLSV